MSERKYDTNYILNSVYEDGSGLRTRRYDSNYVYNFVYDPDVEGLRVSKIIGVKSTDLEDFPSTLIPLKYLKVNAEGTAYELVDITERSIVSVLLTSSVGLVDTYTITYSDSTTSTFDVTNGADGTNGTDGRGIVSIIKTSTVGLVDTYTITYTDATTSTFDVTNGTPFNPVDYIQFNLNYATPLTEGQMAWNDTNKTAEIGLDQGTTLSIGQESLIRATNKTGADILNGKVVYINGSQGNRPTIALASNDAELTSSQTIGVVTSEPSIANNGTGYVCTFGIVRNINTNAYAVGTSLWLSTAGGITSTKPVQPLHSVFIGYVLVQNATTGQIFVNIQNGFELNELHEVLITSATNNDLLQYDSVAGVWKNISNPTIEGLITTKGGILVPINKLISFGDGDTTIEEYSDDFIRQTLGVTGGRHTWNFGGNDYWFMNYNIFGHLTTTRPGLSGVNSTNTVPTLLPMRGNTTTGVGGNSAEVSLISAGVEVLRVASALLNIYKATQINGTLKTGDGGVTNFSEFEADGTLKFNGTATTWEDVDFPIIIRTTGTNIPTLTTLNGNITMPSWQVNDFNICESQEFIHRWKEASTVYWHIHLTTNGLDATNRYVRFEVEYGWVNPSGQWTFPATIDSGDILIPANTPDKTMFILSLGNFTPTGGKIGGHVVARLKRIASTGTAPTNNPWIPMLQLHVECDTVGSRLMTSK